MPRIDVLIEFSVGALWVTADVIDYLEETVTLFDEMRNECEVHFGKIKDWRVVAYK